MKALLLNSRALAGARHLRVIDMEHEHSAEAIKQRLSRGPTNNYLHDWIYGGIDGSLTTFAVVSGVIPTASLLFSTYPCFRNSVIVTAAAFFAIGSVKSRWSTASWFRSGSATLFVGAIAAGLALRRRSDPQDVCSLTLGPRFDAMDSISPT